MTLRSIITRTATIALAAAALTAPTASARPADMPPAVAKTTAATQHQQGMRSVDASEYPTRPAQGEQANPQPDATTTTAPAERDIAWTTIGIGVAGGLLALGAIGGLVRHTRRGGRARVTA
jgi:hypothetical protein